MQTERKRMRLREPGTPILCIPETLIAAWSVAFVEQHSLSNYVLFCPLTCDNPSRTSPAIVVPGVPNLKNL